MTSAMDMVGEGKELVFERDTLCFPLLLGDQHAENGVEAPDAKAHDDDDYEFHEGCGEGSNAFRTAPSQGGGRALPWRRCYTSRRLLAQAGRGSGDREQKIDSRGTWWCL